MDLPHNLLLYIFLIIALGIGFLLGRREQKSTKPQETVIKDYYQGLNFLLGERPELGVDRFIQAMQVNDDSVDVHLALASVVRRRGEVDKAIRLHQNLLASPALNASNKRVVEYELARDYHAAGLLDRAEGLLKEIVQRRDGQHPGAIELLVDLYEQEKDWAKAIEVSQKVKGDRVFGLRRSHFHCEYGEEQLAAGDLKGALENARLAVKVEAMNPRAHWLMAEIESQQKKHKSVVKRLNKVVDMQHDLSGEVLPLFGSACESLGSDTEYLDYLQTNLKRRPDPRLLAALIEFRQRRGLDLDLHEVVTYIEAAPSDQHLAMLLDLLDQSDSAAQQRIRKLAKKVAHGVHGLQCRNCGFSTKVHQWQCPTCKQWGSFAHPDGVIEPTSAKS